MRLFLVIAIYVRTAHVLLGASSEHSATSLGREAPYDGTHILYTYITYVGRLTVAQGELERETGDAIISIRIPTRMCCRGPVNEDGTHG